jgi:uncharacterized membrane protein
VQKNLLARWQANFLAGLAIVLPAVVSVALLVWLFHGVANITDGLLVFLPHRLTHDIHGDGAMYWYWSLVALVVAVFLICAVGLLARNYLGKRMIEWVDFVLLHVPLLNKVYGTMKQVNDAFSTGSKTSFRTVVLVEYPRLGIYSVGFVTSEQPAGGQLKLPEKIVCVFIPTTPNPTSGFLLLVPEDKVIKLEMSVADGIKYVISLGTIQPEMTLLPRRNPIEPPENLAALRDD